MAFTTVCRKLPLVVALLAAAPVHAEQTKAFRETVTASVDQAPPDVNAAIMAVVALLRGLPEAALPGEVSAMPGVAEKLRDPHTRFEGFDLTSFHLGYLGPSPYGKESRRIVGTLVFADDSGRQAEQTYAIDYGRRAGGILIHDAKSARQAPLRPRVKMHAVPVGRVPADFFQKVRPFGEMLGWLANNAIDAHITGKEAFYVFAVSLDRLGEGDQLIIDAGESVAQTRLDIGGWQLAVRRIEAVDRPLTLRTSYRPDKQAWIATDVAKLVFP